LPDLVAVQSFDVLAASNCSIHASKCVEENEQFSITIGDD
jgi:hypothetical protein